MLSRLIRFLRQLLSKSEDDPRFREIVAQMREAEEKAWWKGKIVAVGRTDQALLVIVPGGNADAGALMALGVRLREWQGTRPYVRHIWGLEELLEGHTPRTPPLYLGIPHSCERFEESFDPVALVFVAAKTDQKAAVEDLARHLEAHLEMLAWFCSPDYYSLVMR